MTPVWRAGPMLAAVGVLIAGTLLVASTYRDTFPHEAHAGLFPLCVGCHAGIPSGDLRAYYPEPAACGACHDGQVAAAVEWNSPSREPSNLRFAHPRHSALVAAADTAKLDCVTCHTERGAPRMQVQPPLPDRCFDCHSHAATEHFVDASCAVCHVPLVETSLPSARLAVLPVPSTHRRDEFLSSLHGELAAATPATCATCHAREQCLGCHVAIAAGSPVERVPVAGGRMILPRIAARYSLPDSHRDPEWELRHGASASRTSCGTCHTRESCVTCHETSAPAAVASLPSGRDASAPGVVVSRRMPASHASPFFVTGHGSIATARPQSCATCHERVRFCGACHEPGSARTQDAVPMQDAVPVQDAVPGQRAALVLHGAAEPGRWQDLRLTPVHLIAASDTPPPAPPASSPRRTSRGFHPPNYVLRHSAEAYGRRIDCSNCHSVQLFCRDCHQSAGRGSVGRLGPGYHDAEPVWLLRHGQAARQTLESCTSCHTQRDCMQCHSQLGSFRVNPHGPGFDARRAQRANPQICRACHLADPLAPP